MKPCKDCGRSPEDEPAQFSWRSDKRRPHIPPRPDRTCNPCHKKRRLAPHDRVCEVMGCERKCWKRSARWCGMHQSRVRKRGHTGGPDPEIAAKGTGSTNPDGYRLISVGGRRVLEHRHMMSIHLGRDLYPDETVHHKNGVRDDNRLENFELWSSSQPAGQRVEDKLDWAREIIRRYDGQLSGGPQTH